MREIVLKYLLILQKCYAFTTLTHGLIECDKYFISVIYSFWKNFLRNFSIVSYAYLDKVHIFIKYLNPLFTLIYWNHLVSKSDTYIRNLFRSILFERNIFQLYFITEKHGVISYANVSMISFQNNETFYSQL